MIWPILDFGMHELLQNCNKSTSSMNIYIMPYRHMTLEAMNTYLMWQRKQFQFLTHLFNSFFMLLRQRQCSLSVKQQVGLNCLFMTFKATIYYIYADLMPSFYSRSLRISNLVFCVGSMCWDVLYLFSHNVCLRIFMISWLCLFPVGYFTTWTNFWF